MFQSRQVALAPPFRLAEMAVVVLMPNAVVAASSIGSLAHKCNSGNNASCAKLLDLIQRPASKDVKLAAVKSLTRDDLLVECIENTSIDKEVRVTAATRLANERDISRIATSTLEPEIRIAAIHRLKDAAVLSDIFRHEADPSVRRAAADQITDPDLIDSLVGVRILSAVKSPDLLIPRVRPGKDGKPELSFGSIRAGKGSIMLSLQLAIQTPQQLQVKFSPITLHSAIPGPNAQPSGALLWTKPFIGGVTSSFDDGTLPEVAAFWIRAFGGRLSDWGRHDSLVIDDGSVLDVALPAPSIDLEKQILWVGSKPVGSLESLGLPDLK